jgi:hypothetical protein
MPIANFSFRKLSEILFGLDDPTEPQRPWLNIKVFNPRTNVARLYCGLIDTGADSIMIPASFASQLGHDLTSVPPTKGITGAGITTIYYHSTCAGKIAFI